MELDLRRHNGRGADRDDELGVFLAASAGNTGANSCDRLPRGLAATLAVGATTITDTRASVSSTRRPRVGRRCMGADNRPQRVHVDG